MRADAYGGETRGGERQGKTGAVREDQQEAEPGLAQGGRTDQRENGGRAGDEPGTTPRAAFPERGRRA
ncbi:hypothetical protein [Streptomyces beijiangensis]|uniref:Uncharacterized protein n=1 Tax=Streptomyces beijiangensis TaxID=163361 RepID=A0A939F329_9ACTN|nr:hypothetical protein [Streptomyces beijiangensis]MBO0511360.1 hypothetical protein [Streptomyces beijiangensis]